MKLSRLNYYSADLIIIKSLWEEMLRTLSQLATQEITSNHNHKGPKPLDGTIFCKYQNDDNYGKQSKARKNLYPFICLPNS